MKGLRKVIAPFAPDQSGAVSVLFGLGGIVVICDAGGCTGNVCDFDEPRWALKKSAIFSAGLRDMDAILGRDDRLVAKLKDTADKLDCKFAAIVGTPVPAVIATDYHALCRMAEHATDLPVIGIETTGTKLYDVGAGKAYKALLKKFVQEDVERIEGRIGVFGVTPLDFDREDPAGCFHEALVKEGWQEVLCFGFENGLEDYQKALSVEMNLVVAPSGLSAARYMKKKYGIPYTCACPAADTFVDMMQDFTGKKVLVVEQQILGNEVRSRLRAMGAQSVTVASWFMMEESLCEAGDVALLEEDQWEELVRNGQYDVIIGDQMAKKAVPFYEGKWINTPHYAMSGQLGRR